MFYPDSPILGRHIIAIHGSYARHGIGIENNLVVCLTPVLDPNQQFQSQIQCIPIQAFANGWELRYAQYQNISFNLQDVRNRAVSSVGTIDAYSFNLSGDNFAFWCITGNHLQTFQANNAYFGQHLYVDRIGYQHHGIGIENGLVVHFNYLQGEHVIHIVNYHEFSRGSEIKLIPYKTRFDLLQVRNRALNNIGRSGYDLFENNCEHFATWCLAGIKESIQVDQIRNAITTGLVVSAGLATIYAIGKLLEEEDYE